jgi:hypothetical protein
MLALDNDRLAKIMLAARRQRSARPFLERVAARLQLRGSHFTDADLGAAIQAALTGLIQSAA